MTAQQIPTYQNVMEALVAEEVRQQLRHYPQHLAKYINQIEVETYALNRLPALYASCTEGWRKQRKRAESEYGEEITQAVRQGLAAVQRDPIRLATPITGGGTQDYRQVKEALATLIEILQPEEPSWQGLAKVAKRTLSRTRLSRRSATKLMSQETNHWTDYHQAYRY